MVGMKETVMLGIFLTAEGDNLSVTIFLITVTIWDRPLHLDLQKEKMKK